MREEIIRLQRSLNQERIRVRALTEDAKTPTGVHRWRILKGEDPPKFQLLSKVQMLQRFVNSISTRFDTEILCWNSMKALILQDWVIR